MSTSHKLHLQKFLRTRKLEDLAKPPYAINTRRHTKYPNLVLFKYSQISSSFDEPMVCESRGIVLDEANDWCVVSFPYTKFFNYGEPLAACIDWKTSKVYAKEDGSLMTVYYYKGTWHVSSSGVPDASGSDMAGLFWRTWGMLGYAMPIDKTKCYMFEMATPSNRVIVLQKTSKIVLHGVRCLKTYQESDPVKCAHQHGWVVAKAFEFDTMDAVLEAAKSLDPSVQEGFVVCDASFNRVKIKSPGYVAAHHHVFSMRAGKDQTECLLGIIQANESTEVIVTFPHLKNKHDLVLAKYNDLIQEIQDVIDRSSRYPDRKSLAIAISGLWYKACVFSVLDGKVSSVREWMGSVNPKKLARDII